MKTSPYITFFTKDYNRRHDPWKIPYDVPAAFPVLDGSPTETAKKWAGEGYKEYRYQNTFSDVRIVLQDLVPCMKATYGILQLMRKKRQQHYPWMNCHLRQLLFSTKSFKYL